MTHLRFVDLCLFHLPRAISCLYLFQSKQTVSPLVALFKGRLTLTLFLASSKKHHINREALCLGAASLLLGQRHFPRQMRKLRAPNYHRYLGTNRSAPVEKLSIKWNSRFQHNNDLKRRPQSTKTWLQKEAIKVLPIKVQSELNLTPIENLRNDLNRGAHTINSLTVERNLTFSFLKKRLE